jgi:hypothetical protein
MDGLKLESRGLFGNPVTPIGSFVGGSVKGSNGGRELSEAVNFDLFGDPVGFREFLWLQSRTEATARVVVLPWGI